MLSPWEILLRLSLAVIAGGLIGLEREIHGRTGFRTQILVCLGATLIMLLSIYGFAASGIDEADGIRQISSSGGKWYRFSWCRYILRDGPSIKGLTTAASLGL